MSKKTILIAEDEDHLRTFISHALNQLGYLTVEASDGVDALEKLNQHIDLVILDVSMPELNGFDLIRAIRRQSDYEDLPLMVMTGLDSRAQRLTAIECGANEFISKPMDFDELKIRVASLIRIKDFQKEVKALRADSEVLVSTRTELIHEALGKVTGGDEQTPDILFETLEGLAYAVEQRDVDRSRHLHRMSEYSAILAQAVGMSSHDVEKVKMASVMHDVGKLAVPSSILNKPGRLTAKEREEMEVHAEVGASMLAGSNAEFMKMGEVIALTHHEKWDGSGYPQGLKGEEIPLVGRICGIADVFDALTSVRAYKEAYSLDKAWEIMQEGRESHFDPDLLDFFTAEKEAVEAAFYQEDPAGI